mmetsp:Transcript_36071/g.92969  ORF Transcript_36071/g.92969 Transcript_36071/m.92969 type:complete len:223 (-) Transcript_36071:742-1410(-)
MCTSRSSCTPGSRGFTWAAISLRCAGEARSPRTFLRLTASSFWIASDSAPLSTLPWRSLNAAEGLTTEAGSGAVAAIQLRPGAGAAGPPSSRADTSSSSQESIAWICSFSAFRCGTSNSWLSMSDAEGSWKLRTSAFAGTTVSSALAGTSMPWSRKNSWATSVKFCVHCPLSSRTSGAPGGAAALAGFPASVFMMLSMSDAVNSSPARGTTGSVTGRRTSCV